VIANDGQVWWQGYDGEEVILFDDFRGEAKYGEMYRLTHEFDSKNNAKGGSAHVNPAFVIFTSNIPWRTWWKGDTPEAFDRRITDHLRFYKGVPGKFEPARETATEKWPGTYVITLKGRNESVADPPDDTMQPLTDEAVEAIIEAAPVSATAWLPVKKRAIRRVVRDDEDDSMLEAICQLKTLSQGSQ